MDRATRTDPRDRLIDAAADLFHARSYNDVAIREVCDAAAVRRGSVYYYFRSKAELGIAALERSTDLVIEAVHRPAFTNSDPPARQLARFVDLLRRYNIELSDRLDVHVGCPIANLTEELATISPDIRQKAIEQFERFGSYYEAFIDRAMEEGDAPPGDAATVATRFLALVQGTMLQVKVAGNATALAELLTSLSLITGLHTEQ